MNTAIFNFGNVGHPAATMPRTNPAEPGYVLATRARARSRHVPVPGISHRLGEYLA